MCEKTYMALLGMQAAIKEETQQAAKAAQQAPLRNTSHESVRESVVAFLFWRLYVEC